MANVRKVLCAIGGAMALASVICTPAQASIVTGSFNFTASGFAAGAPVDPVTGHVAFTFDNSFNFFNVTTGIDVSLNIAGTVGPGMNYFPAFDILQIGDLVNDVNSLVSGTNDYLLLIEHVSTNPHIIQMFYTEVSDPLHAFSTREVSIAATTPEPTTFALLMLGLAGLAVTRSKLNAYSSTTSTRAAQVSASSLVRLVVQRVGTRGRTRCRSTVHLRPRIVASA